MSERIHLYRLTVHTRFSVAGEASKSIKTLGGWGFAPSDPTGGAYSAPQASIAGGERARCPSAKPHPRSQPFGFEVRPFGPRN